MSGDGKKRCAEEIRPELPPAQRLRTSQGEFSTESNGKTPDDKEHHRGELDNSDPMFVEGHCQFSGGARMLGTYKTLECNAKLTNYKTLECKTYKLTNKTSRMLGTYPDSVIAMPQLIKAVRAAWPNDLTDEVEGHCQFSGGARWGSLDPV